MSSGFPFVAPADRFRPLLPPLLRQFSAVGPALYLSLVIYVAVLTFSALLGIYYLLINRETRAW
ncbi:MAG: hypothetical protein ACRDGM_03430 [bacterium]